MTAPHTTTVRRKVVWTVGNLLMVFGLYVLLYVGGMHAMEYYNVYAASGNTPNLPIAAAPESTVPTVEPTAPTSPTAPASPTSAPTSTPAPTDTPREADVPAAATSSEGQFSSIVPAEPAANQPSTITRIVIPTIKVDRKVIEAAQIVEQQENGQPVATWAVDKYRVGHHHGSSNPGGGGNIVLSGHSGGAAYPFNDIYWLEAGDQIQLYSDGKIYEYAVSDHILVDEVGQPLEQRLENARYIGPTDEEMITMVACWPLSGPDKFKQRIIIRAKPTGVVTDDVAATP